MKLFSDPNFVINAKHLFLIIILNKITKLHPAINL